MLFRSDVVRGASNCDECIIFPPARQLRDGIIRSSQATYNYKHVLPKPFALLCQLEELSDVSLSFEKRLQTSERNGGNRTGTNNQNYSRCLELCMSNGHEYNTEDNSIANFVGIETDVIPNLSTSSLAGIKVLLKGPLDIRHQILLLHQANCFVLGGCVDELVRHQREAIEKAKRTAGVGIDPTIRALIGNTDLDDDGEEIGRAHV